MSRYCYRNYHPSLVFSKSSCELKPRINILENEFNGHGYNYSTFERVSLIQRLKGFYGI